MAKTYETDYEMPCTSGVRGHRKSRKLRRWAVPVCVCVCVCVCVVSLAALRVRFPVCSGGLFVSLYDTHKADTLGRNWYAFLTAGRNSYVPGNIALLTYKPSWPEPGQIYLYFLHTDSQQNIRLKLPKSYMVELQGPSIHSLKPWCLPAQAETD
jgi:hypothetical protein